MRYIAQVQMVKTGWLAIEADSPEKARDKVMGLNIPAMDLEDPSYAWDVDTVEEFE